MAPIAPEAHASNGLRLLPVSGKNLAAVLVAGLLFRLFFIAHFPFMAGDTKFYEELARNWLDYGVYGLFVNGQLLPVDMRMPGYPALLAVIYAIAGRSDKWVMLAQAGIDLASCVAAALLAARLAPESKRTAVATAAAWIAALCPFTANYAAAILTESLATFFTTVALMVLAVALSERALYRRGEWLTKQDVLTVAGWFLTGSLLVAMGTLVRPETPLILAAAGAALLWLCLRRQVSWRMLILAVVWMAVGLILPLTPWAIRNARTLGRIEFLAPYYAQSNGDFIPTGFYAWTRTWMVHEQDNYRVPWRLGRGTILIQALPNAAFDSPGERSQVAHLLRAYNGGWRMTPVLNRQFAALARERAARHPLRTHLYVPVARVLMIWLQPRVELLRYSGDLWPLREKWRENTTDFEVSLGYGLLNILYIGLGIAGAWRCRANPTAAMIVLYLIFRTVLLAAMPTIEPRYVVVCFLPLIALAAQAFAAPAAGESIESRAVVELANVAS